MYQCTLTEDQAKQTHYALHTNYGINRMLLGTEFLIQDGLLENFLHYTREWSHVPGCVSHSLCRSALFNTASLCLQHTLPLSPWKTCYQQTFSAWKNGPSCGFSLSFFILIFLTGLLLCYLTQKFTYLFSPFFLLTCQNNLNFKETKNYHFNYCFLFSCRNRATKATSR